MGINLKFWTWGKRAEPEEEPTAEAEEADADLDMGGWRVEAAGGISKRRDNTRA